MLVNGVGQGGMGDGVRVVQGGAGCPDVVHPGGGVGGVAGEVGRTRGCVWGRQEAGVGLGTLGVYYPPVYPLVDNDNENIIVVVPGDTGYTLLTRRLSLDWRRALWV
jgi:hypothetical protein